MICNCGSVLSGKVIGKWSGRWWFDDERRRDDDDEDLAFSPAKAPQKALCVMKLSLLEKSVPQSHRYSRVPQILE